MKPIPFILLSACFSLGLVIVSFGEESPDAKLADFTIGKSISGPTVKLADLKGKVVAIENWGIH